MKQAKKILVFILVFVLSISIIPATNASAAAKVKLNKTKATIYVGKTVTLKLKNNKKKVKWSTSSKKIATVTSKGKVKGKKAGKATITAKVGKKKYKCKITVKAPKKIVKPTPQKKPTVPTISDNFSKLKKYILTYGSVNNEGNWYISENHGVNDQYSVVSEIVYDQSTGCFNFEYYFLDNMSSVIFMEVNPNNNGWKRVDYFIESKNYDYGALAHCYVNNATYDGKATINFTIDNSTGMEYSEINEFANLDLQIAFESWSYVLNLNLNMSMRDIGFSNYYD